MAGVISLRETMRKRVPSLKGNGMSAPLTRTNDITHIFDPIMQDL
jgi:hypothetical protein